MKTVFILDDNTAAEADVPAEKIPPPDALCMVTVDGVREFARCRPNSGRPAAAQCEFEGLAGVYGQNKLLSNRITSKKAGEKTVKWILEHNLPVHLSGTRFSAEKERLSLSLNISSFVDLHELCEMLRKEFHCSVSLVFLGPRDCAAITGGIGPCGRRLCCGIGLGVDEVGLKSARDLGLPLTDSSVGGLCGRVKCCMTFEKPENNK